MQETISADLLLCPAIAPTFPVDQAATLTPGTRLALIGLGMAFAANYDQLYRLIEWVKPGSCPAMPARQPAK